MSQKELYGPQVAGPAIDEGRFGPAKRMRSKKVRVKSDVGEPAR
jgi:hypothetical protein